MRDACLRAISDLISHNPQVVYIGSDVSAGASARCGDAARAGRCVFIEGIAEQHLVSAAVGMALTGHIVYLNTIAAFLTRRAFEQIAVDACLHQAPVRLIGNGGGSVYAPLGPTHLALDDLALLRPLPHLTVFVPADADEMYDLVCRSLYCPGPVYVRVGGEAKPLAALPDDLRRRLYVPGHPPPAAEVVIVTTGTCRNLSLEAAALLEAGGIATRVVHVPVIKPFPWPEVKPALAHARLVVTVEDHGVEGGLGSILADRLAQATDLAPVRLHMIGYPAEVIDSYGDPAALMRHYGLSPGAIARTIRRWLNRDKAKEGERTGDNRG